MRLSQSGRMFVVFFLVCGNFLVSLSAAAATASAQQKFPDALPIETIPSVERLPATYPDTWIYALDLNFVSLVDGKMLIVDVAADSQQFKGMLTTGMVGGFQASKDIPELYVTMTVYSRLTYGERTDVLVVYDKRTLLPIDEIILPAKRMQVITQPNAFVLMGDGRRALVTNFTPASSVTVVDLIERTVLGEVDIPGCNFVFPTGRSSFSSLCSDGSLASYELDQNAKVLSSARTDSFIDIEADPLFVKSAQVNGIHYFPSFQGRLQAVDFRGSSPIVLKDWHFVPQNLRSDNWRPSGWQMTGANGKELFVIMGPDGKEGSHKDPGSEVWVLDPVKQKLLRRISLPKGGVSLTLTKSTPSYLVVTNAEMTLDVIDSQSGKFKRNLVLNMAAFPYELHAD